MNAFLCVLMLFMELSNVVSAFFFSLVNILVSVNNFFNFDPEFEFNDLVALSFLMESLLHIVFYVMKLRSAFFKFVFVLMKVIFVTFMLSLKVVILIIQVMIVFLKFMEVFLNVMDTL